MREITFRIWSKANPKNKMIGPIPLLSDFWKLNQHNQDEIEIMQYTGLKDKNGKEIYEGDVVQHREKEVGKLEVQFWEGQWVGVADDTACQPLWDNDWNKKSKGEYKQHNLEIIGNIYENPDLLV